VLVSFYKPQHSNISYSSHNAITGVNWPGHPRSSGLTTYSQQSFLPPDIKSHVLLFTEFVLLHGFHQGGLDDHTRSCLPTCVRAWQCSRGHPNQPWQYRPPCNLRRLPLLYNRDYGGLPPNENFHSCPEKSNRTTTDSHSVLSVWSIHIRAHSKTK
jgi:hypothetical protein